MVKRNLSIGAKIPGWEYVTVNKPDIKSNIDILGLKPIPYEDGTINNVYLTDTIEFLTDEAISHLINELKRVTVRGGKIRMCMLNSMLLYYSFRNNDRQMFFDLIERYPMRFNGTLKKDVSTEQLWVYTFASQLSEVAGGTYSDEDIKVNFETLGLSNFWSVLKSEINLEEHCKNPMFINAITIGDIHELLAKHDIKLVHISGYGQSPLAEVRNVTLFDNTFPQSQFFLEIMR